MFFLHLPMQVNQVVNTLLLAHSGQPLLFTSLAGTAHVFFMKRGDRPEGYRQMRPKTFPASNYSGNSQQMMLHEIRESLRNISLSRPSDALKGETQGQQGRSTNHKNPYHKALQEIRESLEPFANGPAPAGHAPEVNVQMLQELLAAGFDEV